VTIEGLDTCENLAVVSAGDQDLSARTDSGLEDGERTGGKFVLLNLSDFIFTRQQSVLTKSKHRGGWTYVNSERGFESNSLQFVSACAKQSRFMGTS
jgi:hypothetical protein